MPTLESSLARHPATPSPAVNSIDVSVTPIDEAHVAFRYCLRGDMARLRVPARQAPARTDLLWEHTCFEAFVGLADQDGYREFNFSPSGQWAAYDFSGYRQRILPDPVIAPPQITMRLTDGRLELEAVLRRDDLPVNPEGSAWRIGLCAVVEAADTVDGGHSYWALRHPSPRPDFHVKDGFLLHLAGDEPWRSPQNA